jgi:hypothetical protein
MGIIKTCTNRSFLLISKGSFLCLLCSSETLLPNNDKTYVSMCLKRSRKFMVDSLEKK